MYKVGPINSTFFQIFSKKIKIYVSNSRLKRKFLQIMKFIGHILKFFITFAFR